MNKDIYWGKGHLCPLQMVKLFLCPQSNPHSPQTTPKFVLLFFFQYFKALSPKAVSLLRPSPSDNSLLVHPCYICHHHHVYFSFTSGCLLGITCNPCLGKVSAKLFKSLKRDVSSVIYPATLASLSHYPTVPHALVLEVN